MASPSPVPSPDVEARQNRRVARTFCSSSRPAPSSLMWSRCSCGPEVIGSGDRRAGRRCVECVVEEVVEDLLDRARHGLDDGRRVETVGAELDLARLGDGGPRVDAVGAEAGEVDDGASRSVVGAGQLQEVVDQCAQAVGLLDGGVELRELRRRGDGCGGSRGGASARSAVSAAGARRRRRMRVGRRAARRAWSPSWRSSRPARAVRVDRRPVRVRR